MHAESDVMGDSFAAAVPLVYWVALLVQQGQCIPEIAAVHEVHRQDRVALQTQTSTLGSWVCGALKNYQLKGVLKRCASSVPPIEVSRGQTHGELIDSLTG